MSFLDNFFKRRPTKIDLIRSLIKYRIAHDPMALLQGINPDIVDSQPDIACMGTPESVIVTIIEGYLILRRNGSTNEVSIGIINELRSVGVPSGALPSPISIGGFIRYRLELEHPNSPHVNESLIMHSIDETRKFFGDI